MGWSSLRYSPGVNASEYLASALDLIEREALFSGEVDWPRVRAEAQAVGAGATGPGGTYPAIRHALAALNDHHSHLRPPSDGSGVTSGALGLRSIGGVVARVRPGGPAARAGVRPGERVVRVNGALVGPGLNAGVPGEGDVALVLAGAASEREVTVHRGDLVANEAPRGWLAAPGVGLLSLPDHDGDGSLPGGTYQDTVQLLLFDLTAQGARSWIVDLRHNEGGNMWPMLAGIGPLAGEGELGAFVRGLERWPWSYRDGAAWIGGEAVTRATGPVRPPVDASTRVAVLTSPLTSSSGEIVAMSFVGRPNTRSFGEITQGLVTSNSLFDLPDGARLLIATAWEADRTGREHREALTPDQSIPTDWARFQTLDDPVICAALEWLG